MTGTRLIFDILDEVHYIWGPHCTHYSSHLYVVSTTLFTMTIKKEQTPKKRAADSCLATARKLLLLKAIWTSNTTSGSYSRYSSSSTAAAPYQKHAR